MGGDFRPAHGHNLLMVDKLSRAMCGKQLCQGISLRPIFLPAHTPDNGIGTSNELRR